MNKAVLLHKTENGYVTDKLQVAKIAQGKQPDVELQANDVVFIPNNRLKNALSGGKSVAQSVGSAAIYAIIH